MAGKQARPLSEVDLRRLLRLARQTRYPERDRAIVLLSVKAGLRACEIAGLTWAMLLDANGRLAPILEVRDSISKRGRGRIVPLNSELRTALADLQAAMSPHRD